LLSLFSLFEVFRLHANKAIKTLFFRFKAKKKFASFSLLSEYERRTLVLSPRAASLFASLSVYYEELHHAKFSSSSGKAFKKHAVYPCHE
jgi:hypothetical protein